MSIARALVTVSIFIFFAFISFFTLLVENDLGENVFGSTGFVVDDYQNMSGVEDKPTSLDSASGILSVWDFLLRFLDLLTVGVVFYTNSMATTLVNIFVLIPLRILLVWNIIELIRGN